MAQVKFISISEFNEYINDRNLETLKRDFDLLKILLLDSSKKELFFRYDSEIEVLFSEYAESMKLSKATTGFVTNLNEIKDIFNAPERILNCLFNGFRNAYRIDQPIYIHENRAIVEIISHTTADLYYIRIHEGVVQINWLGGIIH